VTQQGDPKRRLHEGKEVPMKVKTKVKAGVWLYGSD
jgi:hypothetical protein